LQQTIKNQIFLTPTIQHAISRSSNFNST